MIRLGLKIDEKKKEIENFLKDKKIKKIILFYPEEFQLKLPELEKKYEIKYVEYAEIIMYRTFYPLLEIIDKETLLIFNECMRTQNRSDLTYNCAHHYCNQTPHKIVFEYFPFIENEQDFMILLDLLNNGKYKGKSFKDEFLKEEDIKAKPIYLNIEDIKVNITEEERIKYEKYKEELFNNLGARDPDTIPRQLHIWAGNLKKRAILPTKKYVARNKRFNMPNIFTYKEVKEGEEYIIIDFPHRRIDFNDFLKTTQQTNVKFLNTYLKVDLYYFNDLKSWYEKVVKFYAKTSLYQ
jgi:hypothetical protein